MSLAPALLLAGLIFLAAFLYSSVGHGGASGYLAAMALFGLAPEAMRPTALVLNLLVAGIAAVQFFRAGWFSWALFWPFAAGSIPLAFLGGSLAVSATLYKQLLAVVLFFAAWRLFLPASRRSDAAPRRISPALAILVGAAIGMLAGLTGVGGGIFLSPLLLVGGWAQPKPTAAVSAAFIWVNSLAGLLGRLASVHSIPPAIGVWAAAAILGGLWGAALGSRRLPSPVLRRLLAAVLIVAGVKLILV